MDRVRNEEVRRRVGKRQSLLWTGDSQWKINYDKMWGQLSTTCSNLLK